MMDFHITITLVLKILAVFLCAVPSLVEASVEDVDEMHAGHEIVHHDHHVPSLVEANVEDFDEMHAGYEIIYHDHHDLVIVIHENKCYFHNLPDAKESSMDSAHDRTRWEVDLINMIRTNTSGKIVESSLDDVRDKYQDRLADFHCLDKLVFETTVISCPNGWTAFEGSCYKSSVDHVDYNIATSQCQQLGGYVVEITSEKENNFIKDFHRTLHGHDDPWIGVTDWNNHGQYMNLEHLQQTMAHHWLYSLGHVACVCMHASTGEWKLDSCHDKHTYICEKQG